MEEGSKLSRRPLPVETESINAATGAGGEDEGEDLGRWCGHSTQDLAWGAEFTEWWLSQAEMQRLQCSDSELREGFLFNVIKALIAIIITIVLFLRNPQRMMQESPFILWFLCQKIFRASKEVVSYWVKSHLAGGEEAGWNIGRLAGDSVNFLG